MSLTIVSGVSGGQVLQRLGPRGANVVITGTGAESGTLRATLLKKGVAVKGWNRRTVGKLAGGKFRVKLESLPVGGPYHLRLEAGAQCVEVAPIFVGDVWILAGQSNMEGVGNMTGAAKPHPLVLAFSMRREWRLAEDPLHILNESPDKCHAPKQCTVEMGERLRRTKPKGVGAGIFFAREMVERTGGVPQGLICTAHGGTSMQQWDPARKKLRGESLYASMLMSVAATGQPVAGLLWYQGESDTNEADAAVYTRRMQRLVAATRRDLRQPRLPWVIVQIARVFHDVANSQAWNSIQDQQRLLPQKIKFLETVAAIDLPLDDAIHIAATGYPRLGVRLARAADRLVHGNTRELPAPRIARVHWVDAAPFSHVEVTFDHVAGELRSAGEPSGFAWVNPEGGVHKLTYRTDLDGNKARLYVSRKPEPMVRLHYGHGFSPTCNITDARDLSLPVAGPLPVENIKPRAMTAFVTQWKITPVVPATKPLDKVTLNEVDALPATMKSYGADGFINEHAAWNDKAGHAFFRARLELSEPMKLEFLMGYDGPFRLWLDGAPFFTDMAGTNPCSPDESARRTRLAAGFHDIVVGMDLNDGLAWGFMLRFVRVDVTAAQLRSGSFVRPASAL